VTDSYGEPSMTTPAATSAPAGDRWMTAREISRESGLREDLVTRFVPTLQTENGPLFGTRHLAIARVVRQLTEIGTPASTIVAAVEELNARPDNEFSQLAGQSGRGHLTQRRKSLRAAVVVAAVVTLAIGGLIGGLIVQNKDDHSNANTSAPLTTTVTTTAPQIQFAIPTTADPLCAEWGPLEDSYNARLNAWTDTDPNVPADKWSPEMRNLFLSAMQVMQAEAVDMRRLAGKAQNPYLASLLNAQATYLETYAARIPNYQPFDHRYWDAVISFSGAVKAMCTAVAPR
jgi:hypothetical protein